MFSLKFSSGFPSIHPPLRAFFLIHDRLGAFTFRSQVFNLPVTRSLTTVDPWYGQVLERGRFRPPEGTGVRHDTKEKAAEVAADFMTTFYHAHIGALETQGFRTTPVPFWLICFSDPRSSRSKGPGSFASYSITRTGPIETERL